jgi:hypothetical protein
MMIWVGTPTMRLIRRILTRFKALVQQQIAAAFYALPQFAHLKYVTPEFLQAVCALVHRDAALLAARDDVWHTHTDRFLDRLDAAFARAIGVETLTPGQSQHLRAAFGARVRDEHSNPEAHAAFARRYEANDDTLIDAFVKEYVAGEWVLQLRKDLNDANGGGLVQ